MATCSRCGESISFRYVEDRCVPIHAGRGCPGYASIRTYSGYRESRESECFQTKCPDCKKSVFFIRHNGGSVWIDPPLGYPWPKHTCMYDRLTQPPKGEENKYLSLVPLHEKQRGENLVLGVGVACETSMTGRSSIFLMATGARDNLRLVVKNSSGYLVGQLVIYDVNTKTLNPFDRQDLKFKVICDISELKTKDNFCSPAICPECNTLVDHVDIEAHFYDQHHFAIEISED